MQQHQVNLWHWELHRYQVRKQDLASRLGLSIFLRQFGTSVLSQAAQRQLVVADQDGQLMAQACGRMWMHTCWDSFQAYLLRSG